MEHDAGSVQRIQHSIKAYRFAQLIGSIVHDIGIGPCMEKYGRCTGDLQEKEGPAYARELLAAFDLPQEDTHRIRYLVAYHHTYDSIDGLDDQILVETDFLVNLYKQQTS